jgi:hypothetical protein
MDENLNSSIFLVESSEQDNNEFGTGFIIHQDGQDTCLLTCAHVIDDIGMEHVQVEGETASVIAMGASDNLDLAVLCVRGLSNQSPLNLLVTGRNGDLITIMGYYKYGQHRFLKPIQGHLGEQGSLKKPKTRGGRIKVWDLNMEADNYLQHGYSGSPVIDENSGKALGIVSYSRGQGDKGLAISVEALGELWQPGILLGLLQTEVGIQNRLDNEPNPQKKELSYFTMEIRRLQRQIESLQRAWDRLADKIEGLEDDRINETRREEIDRLGSVIDRTKKQQGEIKVEMLELEARLQKLENG